MAVVLSAVGAIAIRLAARALSIPTRFVLGLGPLVREDVERPRSFELRWIPTWISIELLPAAPRARVLTARAAGPMAVVALPFSVAVVTKTRAPQTTGDDQA